MTLINCKINQSGTDNPVVGYVSVLASNYLASSAVFYAATPVKYPLVAGEVSFDLLPTDVAKTAYSFQIVASDGIGFETILYQFDAVVPFSPTPINLVSLAPQSGIRYDRRDASLLTLARYLTSNDSFIGFLGNKLWSNKGKWLPSFVYKRGDVVLRNGSSYQYVSDLQASGVNPESNLTDWSLLAQGITIGSMMLYPESSPVPAKFLRCNGDEVSRSVYADLFALLGVGYGVGDGNTTFKIPKIPLVLNLGGGSTSGYIIYTGI
jgi:hypothetical protein